MEEVGKILANVGAELFWNNGTDVYILVDTEAEESQILMQIADIFDK